MLSRLNFISTYKWPTTKGLDGPIAGGLNNMEKMAKGGPPTFGLVVAPLLFEDYSRLEIFP